MRNGWSCEACGCEFETYAAGAGVEAPVAPHWTASGILGEEPSDPETFRERLGRALGPRNRYQPDVNIQHYESLRPALEDNPKGGRIKVTTSAIRGEAIVGMPYMPAKAAAAHLVRQAALELAKYNILVNAIAPGPFVTKIGGCHMHNPETVKAFARFAPLHRLGSTDEIQGLALFLASPASTYVTGSQIVIDGGVLLGQAD